MNYDLGDPARWEYMFPNMEKPLLAVPNVNEDLLEVDDEELEVTCLESKGNHWLPRSKAWFPYEKNHSRLVADLSQTWGIQSQTSPTVQKDEEEESHFDLPPSWVNQIEISSQEFHTRCPNGKKTIIYKKAKLEKFAEYLMRDGITARLSIFNDNELKELSEVREFFKHRIDKLERRVHLTPTGQITEYFLPGRQRALKDHSYKASSSGPESERTMCFYSSARVDGLVKREETPSGMTEYFEDRVDFLCYRHVVFGKRVKKFGPQESSNRPIQKMIERFRRNREKSADEDVAERVFAVFEDRIALTYHLEDQRITASTREFIKPPGYSTEKGAPLQLTPDTTHAFQVNPRVKQPKDLTIYDMLVDLLEAEKRCTDRIRESEDEVREILDDRMKEEITSELAVSVYDTERNEKAKLRRIELEQKQREEELRKRDTELDYLAPFLARIGDPGKLTRQDAHKIKEECLQDLKQRLIDKANLIQARFEKETQELQKRQGWYQQNQMNMTKEDEEDYLNFCSEAMFRIHILELRLSRHKEMAPHRYMQLDDKLRKDPRLADLL